jgi:uncharacterized protein (DUF1800 family)
MDRGSADTDAIGATEITTAGPSAPSVTETTTPAVSTPASLGLLGVLAAALSACGGGGSGGGSSGGSSGGSGPTITPTSTTTYPANDTEAARFLLQTQFSVSDADIATLKTQGHQPWLDAQFNAAQSQTGTDWLDSRGVNVPDTNQNYFNPVFGDWMAWRMLMTGGDQLRKRLTLALSEMMVASLTGLDSFYPPYVIAGYWDMLSNNVFGNFRTLLEEVTLNPAIGTFLNTKGNLKENASTGRQPDENYAREVMQLFTIGLYQLNTDGTVKTGSDGKPIETYGQSDITNLARVFTGYDYDYTRVTYRTVSWTTEKIPTTEFTRDRMAFKASNHSTLAATFLGVTIPANTDGPTALKTALDTLFNHANVGPFFATQMIKRLVTSNPSPAYVGRVASAFNDNGSGVRGDLKAVWKAIFTDTEALTLPTGASAGKLREPMIRVAQWARTFGADSSTGAWQLYDTTSSDWGLGQSPLRAPSVFNFFRPGYVPPNTALAGGGLVAPEFQIHNETTTAMYINAMTVVIQFGYNDIKTDYASLLPIASDAAALLAWLNLHMTANQLSAGTISALQTALNANGLTASSSDAAKRNRIWAAILLVMAAPEYMIQK